MVEECGKVLGEFGEGEMVCVLGGVEFGEEGGEEGVGGEGWGWGWGEEVFLVVGVRVVDCGGVFGVLEVFLDFDGVICRRWRGVPGLVRLLAFPV